MNLKAKPLWDRMASLGIPCRIREQVNQYGSTHTDRFWYGEVGVNEAGERLWQTHIGLRLDSIGPDHGTYQKLWLILDIGEPLVKMGWQFASLRCRGWNSYARLTYGGFVKVELDIGNYETMATVHVKGTDGSFSRPRFTANSLVMPASHHRSTSPVPNKGAIDSLIAAAEDAMALPKPKIERKEVELGEPHGFVEIDQFTQDKGWWSYNRGLIQNIKVVGVVAIAENRDLAAAHNPEMTSVWFHCRCNSYDEDRTPKWIDFDIITDGESWYMAAKSGKKIKAVPGTERTGQLNLKGLSTLDQDLLREAIRHYSELQ